MKDRVKPGDRVRVQYSRLSDDVAPDRQSHRKRMEFTVGSREVISGLSLGVVGMARGEKKRLTIDPRDAYGPVRRELIKEVPRRRFPAKLQLSVGQRLTAVGVTSRRRRQVKVVEVNAETVVIDGNHPLAGRVLLVEVRLIALDSRPSDPDQATRNGDAQK
jgi:FKBP-type peptidyl-prolyl cis-trans isomerase 2